MSGGVWLASYVALWAAVFVLLLVVLALLRQIGVLHTRLDDVAGDVASLSSAAAGGAVGLPADEGPPVGEPAPMPGRLGYARAPMTLVAFTAAGCELSATLSPLLRVVDAQYGDAVRVVELGLGPRTTGAFESFNVAATPFVVCVDRDGIVRASGRARSLGQLEDLVAAAGAAALAARRPVEMVARSSSSSSSVSPAAGPLAPPVAEAEASASASDPPVAAEPDPEPERDPAGVTA
jgi:hypothetical protein